MTPTVRPVFHPDAHTVGKPGLGGFRWNRNLVGEVRDLTALPDRSNFILPWGRGREDWRAGRGDFRQSPLQRREGLLAAELGAMEIQLMRLFV